MESGAKSLNEFKWKWSKCIEGIPDRTSGQITEEMLEESLKNSQIYFRKKPGKIFEKTLKEVVLDKYSEKKS